MIARIIIAYLFVYAFLCLCVWVCLCLCFCLCVCVCRSLCGVLLVTSYFRFPHYPTFMFPDRTTIVIALDGFAGFPPLEMIRRACPSCSTSTWSASSLKLTSLAAAQRESSLGNSMLSSFEKNGFKKKLLYTYMIRLVTSKEICWCDAISPQSSNPLLVQQTAALTSKHLTTLLRNSPHCVCVDFSRISHFCSRLPFIYMYIYIYICTYVRTYVRMYVCMYVCVCVYV